MMSKEYNQKKKNNFIKDWELKRENKLKFSLLQSLYFALPFSIVFQAIESLQGFLTLKFGFKFIVIFSVYFLLSHYVSYNLFEKRYQKFKKQS